MNLRQAKEIIGASPNGNPFGKTSKMPGYSYGLDAFKCDRGSVLARDKRSPCHGCYARRNFYATWGPVIKNRKAHQQAVEDAQRSKVAQDTWVAAMVLLLRHYVLDAGERFFRMHDSGDLYSPAHMDMIARVALHTPDLQIWLPTHEPLIVARWRQRDMLLSIPRTDIPPNLTIRISADYNDQPPTVAGRDHRKAMTRMLLDYVRDLPTSTTHTVIGKPVQVSDRRRDSIECRAHERDHKCGPCRACWSPLVKNVSYPLSGGDSRVSRAQRSTALRVLQ